MPLTATNDRISWTAGKLHALRPVFRELGHCAAFVYEALEQSRGRPQRSFDLTGATGLSRRAVYQALETLAAWHLVQPRDGRWTLVAGTSLQLLAEQFGCLDRSAPRATGTAPNAPAPDGPCVDHHPTTATVIGPGQAYLWPPEPPPEEETLIDLLERELGAHLIAG